MIALLLPWSAVDAALDVSASGAMSLSLECETGSLPAHDQAGVSAPP